MAKKVVKKPAKKEVKKQDTKKVIKKVVKKEEPKVVKKKETKKVAPKKEVKKVVTKKEKKVAPIEKVQEEVKPVQELSNIEALVKEKEASAPKVEKKFNVRLLICVAAAVIVLAIIFCFAKIMGGTKYKLNEIYAPYANEETSIVLPNDVYFSNDGLLYKKVKGNQVDVYAQIYAEAMDDDSFAQVVAMYEGMDDVTMLEINGNQTLQISSAADEGTDYRVYLMKLGDYGFTAYFLGNDEATYTKILESVK